MTYIVNTIFCVSMMEVFPHFFAIGFVEVIKTR